MRASRVGVAEDLECGGLMPLFPATIDKGAIQSAVNGTPREMLAPGTPPPAHSKSLWIGDREISFFAAHKQSRQAARRIHFDFNLVPLAVAGEIRWSIPD